MMKLYTHRRKGFRHRQPAPLAALLLCLSLLGCSLPSLARAAGDGTLLFSSIVTFHSITLHHAASNAIVADGTYLEPGAQLVLRYTYNITPEQCPQIQAETPYYLEVSPHLELPHLESGSPLTIETGDESVRFGMIYANGSQAWVRFDKKADGSGTVLSDYGELNQAYFYLNCTRAGAVPSGEQPIEGSGGLYALKFEHGEQLTFGYAENRPVAARATIQKGGALTDRTIAWDILYTPWQNPSAADPVDLGTPCELRDTIDGSLHSYVSGSAVIDGVTVPEYASRDAIPAGAAVYALAEADGANTLLTFGGTKFGPGQATQGNPASPLKITYQTTVRPELLLPGGSGDRVGNAADLFAQSGGDWHSLGITGQKLVELPPLEWVTKKGTTTRHTDNTGSTTDWTVTFHPNGFQFPSDSGLTLHDRLPAGSSLVENSVKATERRPARPWEQGANLRFPTSRRQETGTLPSRIRPMSRRRCMTAAPAWARIPPGSRSNMAERPMRPPRPKRPLAAETAAGPRAPPLWSRPTAGIKRPPGALTGP